jgi:hypothetical protein
MILTLILAAAAPQAGVCAKLDSDYEHASKALAMVFAEGVGDNSAPRATMREAREANIRNEASQTLDLMQAHKCALPTAAPNAAPYVTQAMGCKAAQFKDELGLNANASEVCDMSKWVNEHTK